MFEKVSCVYLFTSFLPYDGCFVNAYHYDKEIGDFKQLKLNGRYYKKNAEFDKQVESLCKKKSGFYISTNWCFNSLITT